MNRIRLIILLLSFLVPALFAAINPPLQEDRFILRQWDRETGLPHTHISAICQTSDGFLWAGTPTGLFRFDGLQFTMYHSKNIPSLPDQQIVALHQDHYGALWIGTAGGGLCRYKEGTWARFTTQDGLSSNYIRVITSDLSGNVWIGTDYGLNRFRDGEFRHYTTGDGLLDNVILALATDWKGFLWIGTLRGGVSQFQNGVVRSYGFSDGLTNPAVNTLYVDSLNNVWMGTLQGLFYLNRSSGQIRSIAGSHYTPITGVIGDRKGRIWVSTMADGLKGVRKEMWTEFDSAESFPCDHIRTLFCDREGNLWIGSDGDGLFHLYDNRIINISQKSGLPVSAVNVIYQESEDSYWVGTQGGGLCFLADGHVTRIVDSRKGLTGKNVTALFKDDKNSLWIGTSDAGLFSMANEREIKHHKLENFSHIAVTAILQIEETKLLAGTRSGLFQLNKKSGRILSASQLSSRQINSLFQAPGGRIYIATNEGILTYQEGHLDSLHLPKNYDVSTVFEDSKGILWIGTYGNGLLAKTETGIREFTTNEGLPDNHIFSITEDKNGAIWLSSYQGVLRIMRSETDNYPRRDFPYLLLDWFDEKDGMLSSRCRAEGNPSVWRTADGRLCYPTMEGVSIIDPADLPGHNMISPTVITTLMVNGEIKQPGDSLELTAPVTNLSFDFTTPEYRNPRKIRFFFYLAGWDHLWQEISWPDNRVISYQHLPAGEYQLFIKSSLGHFLSQPKRSSLSIFVRLPFYKTGVFRIILSIMIIMVLAVILFYTRWRREKKRRSKYKTSTLDPVLAGTIEARLTDLMKKEKIYLDANLTLASLAKKLKTHPNHLSRIINEKYGQNYNDFINRYRIEEVKKILITSGDQKINLLEIMYDNGFYSKSVFNTAFKKFTGMTPSQFRKQHTTTSSRKS